eukprot:scaffold112955_cov32-Tisochrysis_lutea.AAC.4
MELPDPIIHPTPGGEEGQSAALAAGAARDVVTQSPPATLDSTLLWGVLMGAGAPCEGTANRVVVRSGTIRTPLNAQQPVAR